MSATRAQAVKPDNEHIVRQLAATCFERSEFRQAAHLLRQVVDSGEATSGVFNDLATIQFLLGQVEDAEQSLVCALEMDPGHLPSWRNLGELLLVTNRFDHAMQVFERILAHLSEGEQSRLRPHLERDRRVNPESPHAQGRIEQTWQALQKIRGVGCHELVVDMKAFARFSCANPIALAPAYYEKKLEYYLSTVALDLCARDRFADIASQGSPFPAFVERVFECEVYQQDLEYEPGMHGRRIGSDATTIPVPDAFFTKMTLHCSFEHFEGQADSAFIREAARVLAPGGKLCIVPLYANLEYREQRFENYTTTGEERSLCAGCQFCRTYDAAAFAERVAEPAAGAFEVELFRVANLEAVRAALPPHQNIYAHFMAVLTRPSGHPADSTVML